MQNSILRKNFQQYRLLMGFFCLVLMLPGQLFAQELTISGTVTDLMEEYPLPGVNVVEKGTANGTVTDVDGNYSLTVAGPDAILSFSYIGYLTEEVPVEGRQNVDVAMSQSIEMLSEMVVIGYGVQRKEDLTGSVAVVDVDDMNRINPVSFDRALQGRAAGVHVSSTSGRPGAEVSIKVRGIGSISRSSEPLFVVDGVPLTQGGINSINPKDIESMQVLKDASATAIYGTRGANGVVVITTKRGEPGAPKLSYSFGFTSSQLAKKYDIMNADQYSELMKAAWTNYALTDSTSADFVNLYTLGYSEQARRENGIIDRSTDFQEELRQTGIGQDHSLSIRGGNDRSNYYISGNFFKEDGVMINTGMDRITLRANSDFEVSDRIKIGQSFTLSNVNYIYDSHRTNFNSWMVSLITSPLMALYDEDAAGGYGGPVDTITRGNERTNPIAEQMLNENIATQNRIIANAYADVKIFEGLKYTLRVGAEYGNNYSKQWSPVYRLGNLSLRDNDVSSLMENSSNNEIWQMGNYLEYSNKFGDHNVTAVAGYERLRDYGYNILAGGRNIAFDDLNVLDQATDGERIGGSRGEERLESGLIRLLYDFRGKYLITASLRRDGSSKFAPGKRFGDFPSFSLGYRISDDLFANSNLIDMMKLRFGWGQTGNSNIPRFQYLELIDPFIHTRYTFGANQDLYLGGAPITFQASPLIQWEATEMTNFGLDVNLLNAKIQFTAEYYIKNQDNMLVAKPIPSYFGKRVNYGADGWPTVGAWMNLAQVQNRGLELNLIYRNFDNPFKYSITGNFSTLKNEIIDLGVSEFASGISLSRNGNTIGSFFGHVAERILQEDDFMQDEDGNLITDNKGNYILNAAYQEEGTAPGDIKFKDLNNDGVITDLDRTIIGKPLPDFIYGLDFQFEYKGIDMNIFFNGMHNLDVYNQLYSRIGVATNEPGKDENRLVETLNYWTPENQSTTMTRAHAIDPNRNSRASTWFVEDASFLRVRNVQLGYSLPANWTGRVGISNVRIYGSVNNLYTFTAYRGYDPEIGSQDPLNTGVDGGHYPVPRTFMFGVQLDI